MKLQARGSSNIIRQDDDAQDDEPLRVCHRYGRVTALTSTYALRVNLLSLADSIPGVGGSKHDDEGESKEDQMEQERLRQEAIKQAERDRRDKYKKQEEEREGMRQNIREKVSTSTSR